jgi:hypothetical protein
MGRRRRYALLLWLLAVLFALRVLGQAVQLWSPVAWLPSFESFQGSGLPYWVLLSAQALILTFVVLHSSLALRGMVEPRRERGRVLLWLGGTYLAASLGRIAIGALPGVPQWFRAWIPGAFHAVLAGYVVTLGAYHLRLSEPATRPAGDRKLRRLGTTGRSVATREKEAGPMADRRQPHHG